MTKEPQGTTGGPLDIKEDPMIGNISDAELRASMKEAPSPQGHATEKSPVKPVGPFDPPPTREFHENGETDREE